MENFLLLKLYYPYHRVIAFPAERDRGKALDLYRKLDRVRYLSTLKSGAKVAMAIIVN